MKLKVIAMIPEDSPSCLDLLCGVISRFFLALSCGSSNKYMVAPYEDSGEKPVREAYVVREGMHVPFVRPPLLRRSGFTATLGLQPSPELLQSRRGKFSSSTGPIYRPIVKSQSIRKLSPKFHIEAIKTPCSFPVAKDLDPEAINTNGFEIYSNSKVVVIKIDDTHVLKVLLKHGVSLTAYQKAIGVAVDVEDHDDSLDSSGLLGLFRAEGMALPGCVPEERELEDLEAGVMSDELVPDLTSSDRTASLAKLFDVPELNCAHNLEHPHILSYKATVAVSFKGSSNIFKPGVITEYYPNRSFDCLLADREQSERFLGHTAMFVSLMIDLLSALSYLHTDKKMVHSDIKPGNILLDKSFRAILCDFDIMTRIGDVAAGGTLPYVFPSKEKELDPDDSKATPADDIWALGITAFEALTGTYPLDLIYDDFDSEGFAPLDKLMQFTELIRRTTKPEEAAARDDMLNKSLLDFIPEEKKTPLLHKYFNFIRPMLMLDKTKRPPAAEMIILLSQ